MEITTRSLWTLVHGMGFGALYLLACSGAIVLLYLRSATNAPAHSTPGSDRILGIYLTVMAALAWLTVLTGTYIVYPWYRAAPPASAANPATKQWHLIGMEWKEHVAWLVPIAITMAAFVAIKYARDLKHSGALRSALYGFVGTSLFAAGVAGFLEAMLDKNAPVDGGQTIHLVQGE
jgi:hypothetical protein